MRTRSVLTLVFPLLTAFGTRAEEGSKTPEIPLVWKDEAIASLELPLPGLPGRSPRHVSSSYYHSIPVRPIYRSYPIYHPDHEPPGYWEWLHRQEPEIIFDASRLKTEEDWVRAGELVFTEGGEYSTGSELAFVRDRDAYRIAGVRLTADGRFAYARYFIREKGKVEIGTNACAACHTKVMDNGTVILGGPGDIPLGRMVAYEIRQQVKEATPGKEEERTDRRSIDYRFAAAPWLEPDPGNVALGRTSEGVARLLESLPAGVFVRQRTSYADPVRIPDLIGLEERRFLDATGLMKQRSIADLMRYAALNDGLDELASYGGFRPAAEDLRTLPDPSTLTRRSDEQLYALAEFLYHLEPPENPHRFDEAAERGQRVFDQEGCGQCHTAPLYTNNRLVPAPGYRPPSDHPEARAILRRGVGTDPGLTLRTRRGTGLYKVPSLRGVWYRGPFFHDGSLANLEDVFDPCRLDPDYVPTGFRGPEGDRGAVRGHEFGLDLDAGERNDLIAFLRTL